MTPSHAPVSPPLRSPRRVDARCVRGTAPAAFVLFVGLLASACTDSVVSTLGGPDAGTASPLEDVAGADGAAQDTTLPPFDADPGAVPPSDPTDPSAALVVDRVAPAVIDARGGEVVVEGSGLARVTAVWIGDVQGVVTGATDGRVEIAFGWLEPGLQDLRLQRAGGATARVREAIDVVPHALLFAAAPDDWADAVLGGRGIRVIAAGARHRVHVWTPARAVVLQERADGTFARTDAPPDDPPSEELPPEEPPSGEESEPPVVEVAHAVWAQERWVGCNAQGAGVCTAAEGAWSCETPEDAVGACVAMGTDAAESTVARLVADGDETVLSMLDARTRDVRGDVRVAGRPRGVVWLAAPAGWAVSTSQGVTWVDAAGERQVRVSEGPATAVLAFDADDDGSSDLLVCAEQPPCRLLWGDGTGRFGTAGRGALPLDEAVPARGWAVDLNRDGALDLLLAPSSGWLRLSRNRGDGVLLDETPGLGFVVDGAADLGWADLDGDGALDLVVLERSGGVRVLYAAAARTTAGALP